MSDDVVNGFILLCIQGEVVISVRALRYLDSMLASFKHVPELLSN